MARLVFIYLAVALLAAACDCAPANAAKKDKKSKMSMNIQLAEGMSAGGLKQAPNVVVDATGIALQQQLGQQVSLKDKIEEVEWDPFITNPNGKLRPILWDNEADPEMYNEAAGIEALRSQPLVRKKRCNGGGGNDDGDARYARTRSSGKSKVKKVKKTVRRKKNKNKNKKSKSRSKSENSSSSYSSSSSSSSNSVQVNDSADNHDHHIVETVRTTYIVNPAPGQQTTTTTEGATSGVTQTVVQQAA